MTAPAVCASCWAPLSGPARFCSACGTEQPTAAVATVAPPAATATASSPAVPAVDRPLGDHWWDGWRGFAVVVALAALFFGGRFVGQQAGWFAKGSMPGTSVSEPIQEQLAKQLGAAVAVTCPDRVPVQKNKVVDCTAKRTDGKGSSAYLPVTVTDLDGHFRWELSDPTALDAS